MSYCHKEDLGYQRAETVGEQGHLNWMESLPELNFRDEKVLGKP